MTQQLLQLSANRIVFANPAGRAALDTNLAMYFGIDHIKSSVIGAISLPARSNVGSAQRINRSVNLAAINAACNSVLGWMHLTAASGTPGGAAIPANTWLPIGGTHIHLLARGSGISSSFSCVAGSTTTITHMWAFGFRAAGGTLWFDESYYAMATNAGSGALEGVTAVTINFDALCGAFTT